MIFGCAKQSLEGIVALGGPLRHKTPGFNWGRIGRGAQHLEDLGRTIADPETKQPH